MTWSLVAEVLVLLAAGTGATKWMAREPRPRSGSNSWEIKQLLKARKDALREYYIHQADGYTALASDNLRAVKELDKRLEQLRKG